MNDPKKPTREQPVAMSGDKGEGSYKGTQQYKEGYEKFSKEVSPDGAMQKAKQIDPDQQDLKQAEQQGKTGKTTENGGTGGRISAPSIH